MTQQMINLDEHVRESLRDKIITGALDGGFHLSELKISKEYNVSRTPVREALCALAADGLIEMVPHRGAFVSEIPVNIKADQFKTYGMFLGMLAKLATANGNIELLMDFETSISKLADAESKDEATFSDALSNVNNMMQQASNSPALSNALSMLTKTADTNKIWNNAYQNRKELSKQYTQLLKDIKSGSQDNAESTMRSIMDSLINPVLADMPAPEQATKAN